MTSPMVDTLRNIPLVTEKDTCVPMEAENDDSGFPFDREERDDDFRSQLDDIAKRHPEFAEHLDGFPFRSDSLGRRRPPRPEQAEFRRFDRPFGSSRFERFGFPFSRDPFDEDFEEQVPPPQHQEQSQSQPKQQQQQQQQQEEEEKPKAERSSRKPNIQQSNTVDLGQKQEPVNDRNQRSMSAPPPDNRQRFVSSIHIPINRDGGMGDMGKTQSQPQQPQQQQQEKPVNKPTERVIPIHVEGRDEPVMPKHAGPSFSQPQTERVFGGQPQPERIFGHRPSQFTQFVNREPPRPQQQQAYGYGPQQSQQKFQEVPVQVPKPQQSQQQVPPQPQQQQHQEEPQQEQQQQQQQPPKPTPIDIIQSIQRDVSELMGQVEKFTGLPRDKQYLYLDEMLTRNLIKLDNVDTQGQENIRQARKEAIKCIEGCIGILDAKAAANVPQEKKPEVEETKPAEEENKTEESQEKMEVEAKEEPKQEEEKKEAAPPAEEKVEEVAGPAPEEKMEIIPEPTPAPVEEAPKEEPKPVSEAENKQQPTDEEMKAVPKEEEECKKEAEASKDEKKKGKKKAVKN